MFYNELYSDLNYNFFCEFATVKNRRTFIGQFLGSIALSPLASFAGTNSANADFENKRSDWAALASRIAMPVLAAMAKKQLMATMPFQVAKHEAKRADVASLEIFGRTFYGVAPWLALHEKEPNKQEEETRTLLRKLAVDSLLNGCEENHQDSFNFNQPQALVDMAFLVFGLIQSWDGIWMKLSASEQKKVLKAVAKTSIIKPHDNNWLLFAAMVEKFLKMNNEPFDQKRIEHAINKHIEWYKGDGWFGDGQDFHFDYYNSYVIQPFMLELLKDQPDKRQIMIKIAQRYAVFQERMVAADGTFPPVGRSLVYRCGAFHHLAYVAQNQLLPEGLSHGQLKRALGKVIAKTLSHSSNFNQGWLTIGLSGDQPDLGEAYITTASVYLCLFAFLPLGLPATHAFWTCDEEPLTVEKAFGQSNLIADKAIKVSF